MNTRVYRYGADAPLDIDVVREQLRAAHDYRNELVAIERGRRDAMRGIYDVDAVREAESALKQATKTDRKVAKRALYSARREALATAAERAKEINALAHELQLGARALAKCYWCSYLDIEAAMQQARGAPLYADDGLTPSGPRFERWRDPRFGLCLPGQLAVQLQAHGDKATTTSTVLRGDSTFVRLVRDDGARPNARGKWVTLWLRVGSLGREPVWARVRMRYHREIPDTARWKWVRLSVRAEALREQWSVEITADDPSAPARQLDSSLAGAVAVAWYWDLLDDGGIRVAEWYDTKGEHGSVVLPSYSVRGIRKPDDHRAVRDILWNDVQPKIARALKLAHGHKLLPSWLGDAAATLHLWRSLNRVHSLVRRWITEAPEVAPEALALAKAWRERDKHLYQYEAGMRGQSLRHRREQYRVLAAQWARRYKHVLLSDHELSREARWGEASDVRFTAAPDELRRALRNAFGLDAIETSWDKDARWCERACACYQTGGARGAMFAPPKEKTANAWAKRKAAKLERATARNGDDNHAEQLAKSE